VLDWYTYSQVVSVTPFAMAQGNLLNANHSWLEEQKQQPLSPSKKLNVHHWAILLRITYSWLQFCHLQAVLPLHHIRMESMKQAGALQQMSADVGQPK